MDTSLALDNAIYGTIRVGTINELTGLGTEWLVDKATRSEVIAVFLNGNIVCSNQSQQALVNAEAPTLLIAA